MWHNIGLKECLTFIECQLKPGVPHRHAVRPAITISRQAGAGGHTVASKLAEYLGAHTSTEYQWTVFDKNLVAKVLEEHHLPQRMDRYLSETHRPLFGDMLEEFLGLHASGWTMARQTAETMLNLARLGCVILVGRGAGIITGKLDNAYHIRLVGSFDKRVERFAKERQCKHDEAVDLVRHEDKERKRYVKDNFARDVEDPLLYHLIINTDRTDCEEAAKMVGDQVISRFHLETHRIAA